MNFAKVYSAQCALSDINIVDIETDISRSNHSFTIVGLPDKAVEEAKDRVSSAIKNSGFKSPKQKNEKVVISLAPANLKKTKTFYDLGIAMSYLLATKDITFDSDRKLFLGELSLDGKLRRVNGVLPVVLEAKKKGFEEVFLPRENAEEAALVRGVKVFGVNDLLQITKHLHEIKIMPGEEVELPPKITKQKETELSLEKLESKQIDISEVVGNETAKRGLIIAAAGRHNILLHGPPGTGKTMLAKSFLSILPCLKREEVFETTSIHSAGGILKKILVIEPPFRSPHHTASYASIVGGGNDPRPGEATFAHNGVLFLDELPEFDKRVINALRQPLEDGLIQISRSKGSLTFPAKFILIATMNPCPCGYYGSDKKECVCLPNSIINYQKKISGPIMDRIDMAIEVASVPHRDLLSKNTSENSLFIKKSIIRAQKKQVERNKKLNGDLSSKEIKNNIKLSLEIKEILDKAAKSLNLSGRSYYKVIKIARTIADLEDSEEIKKEFLLEALQYRYKN